MMAAEIEFFGGIEFTRGRKVEWTEFVKCFACEDKFVGRGRTEKAAHEDAAHWAAVHATVCLGQEA